MSKREISQWRTIAIGAFGMALLAACALKGVHGEDLQAVKWGLVGIVGAVASKSALQHASYGGGIRGAAAAVMTSALPGAAVPPPSPAPGGQP